MKFEHFGWLEWSLLVLGCVAAILGFIYIWGRSKGLAVVILLALVSTLAYFTLDWDYWNLYFRVDWGSGGLVAPK